MSILFLVSIVLSILSFITSIVKLAFPNVYVERARTRAMLRGEDDLPYDEIPLIKFAARISGSISLLLSIFFIGYSYDVIMRGPVLDVAALLSMGGLTFLCGLHYVVILPILPKKEGTLRGTRATRLIGVDHFLITISFLLLAAELLWLGA